MTPKSQRKISNLDLQLWTTEETHEASAWLVLHHASITDSHSKGTVDEQVASRTGTYLEGGAKERWLPHPEV